MGFTPRDWRDAPGDLTTPITAVALEDLETRTTAGIPYENVKWHGAVGTDTGDQTAAIQAAIDTLASTGGTVYIPKGIYRLTGSLAIKANVSLLGDGPNASILKWPTTLGAGLWGLNLGETMGTLYFNTVEGLGFQGPAYGATLTMGTAATNMHGVKIGRHIVLRRCRVAGFNYNIGIQDDHCWVEYCNSGGGHYNVCFLSTGGVVQWGDQSFNRCTFDYASMANFGVEDSTMINSCTFTTVHGGLAPYFIAGIGTRTIQPTLAIGNQFFDVSVEGFGNSVIKGSATDTLHDNIWTRGGCSQDDAYKIPATTFNYLVDCGQMTNDRYESDTFFGTSPPAVAWIYSSGNLIQNLRLQELPAPSVLDVAAAGKPILKTASGSNVIACTWKNGQNAGTFKKSAVALTAKQLAKVTGLDACTLYGIADAPKGAAGIAAHACGIGEIVALKTAGPYTLAACTGTVNTGDPVKPSTATAGKVMAAAAGDYPILGVCEFGATNTDIYIDTRLATAAGL